MNSFDLQQANENLMTRRPARREPLPLAAILEKPMQTAVPEPLEPVIEIDKIPARLNELDTTWHPAVKTAVSAARKWQIRRRVQVANNRRAYASLVLVAKGVTGDINCTGYGCGKTHIARSCLWSIAYLMDGEPIAPVGKMFLAEEIINRLDGETQASNELSDAPIIVIDDVGAEGLIPFVRQDEHIQAGERHARYFKLLDYCYNAGISVIITGNLTLDALATHVGGRAWSRLLEMAPAGFMIDMTGVPDYRRRQSGR